MVPVADIDGLVVDWFCARVSTVKFILENIVGEWKNPKLPYFFRNNSNPYFNTYVRFKNILGSKFPHYQSFDELMYTRVIELGHNVSTEAGSRILANVTETNVEIQLA